MTSESENNNKQIKITDIVIEWKIPDFFPPEEKDIFIGPEFEFFEEKWRIELHQTDGCWELFLGKTVLNPSHKWLLFVDILYDIGIKKIDGTVYKYQSSRNNFRYFDEIKKTIFLPTSNLLRDKIQITASNVLVIYCKLSLQKKQVLGCALDMSTQTKLSGCTDTWTDISEEDFQKTKADVDCEEVALLNSPGVKILLENFKNLFLSGENSDVIINVRDQEFKVHRTILGARSKVFSAMFSHDTTEKNSGAMEITDCQPEVFYEFLRYLYTGQVEVVRDDQVLELYVVADKYDVQDLKEECVKCAVTDMSMETFCDVLSLALLHNETALLQSATNFFQENVRSIIVTAKWISFLKKNPIEANELHIKALDYLHSRRN